MMSTSGRSGFTLTELLVATAVGAYLISLAAVCLSLNAKAVRSAEDIAIKTQALAASNGLFWYGNWDWQNWCPRGPRGSIAALSGGRSTVTVNATGGYRVGAWQYLSLSVASPTYRPKATGGLANTSLTFDTTPGLLEGQQVVIHGIDSTGATKRIQVVQLAAGSVNGTTVSGLPTTTRTTGEDWRIGPGDHFYIPVRNWIMYQP